MRIASALRAFAALLRLFCRVYLHPAQGRMILKSGNNSRAGSAMPSFPPVQSVVRASRILQELNRRPVATIDHLHRVTTLPKPTIVRLLETLIHQGLVSSDKRGYAITAGVETLSAGFHSGPLLIEAGRDCCLELTRLHKWPVSLAVLNGAGASVTLLFSTISDSPMAPWRPMLARKRSLLTTAMGRCYLAFCPDDERDLLVRMLISSHPDKTEAADIEAAVKELARRTRRQGYAERDPKAPPNSGSTIAMPVRHDGRVLGMVGIGYFKSAVHDRDVPRILVAPLREAQAQIEQNVAALVKKRVIPKSGNRFSAQITRKENT
jgi:IclR family mhp operon transcriptional activator